MLVEIRNLNKTIETGKKANLLKVLRDNGIGIASSCGGKGTCGKCMVIIRSGKCAPSGPNILSGTNRVLACQAEVTENIVIEIPPESRSITGEIFTPAETTAVYGQTPYDSSFSPSPLSRKAYIELEPPSGYNNMPDLEKIKSALGTDAEIDLELLRNLDKLLRKYGWKFTAVLTKGACAEKLTAIEPGNTSGISYGIALDIGTTTVVAYLTDLDSGRVINAKAAYNRQISYGDDVITRIIYASEPDGLKKLNAAVLDTTNSLIEKLAKEENISQESIYSMQCAGNTTMMHLLFNVSPENIRKEPYVPVFNSSPFVTAEDSGIKINPRGVISCLPGVASYVGGDITAGVLACGMHDSTELSLLVDLGTNGEIVLGNSEWLLCCACSAGPAFEGVGIKCGIRAMKGAIQNVELAGGAVKYGTIDNAPAVGICGSGLLDIPAEFLKKGIIDRAGKFTKSGEASGLIRKNADDELEFVIVPAEKSATGADIVITEPDIANLLRSKGAVYLGIQVLLKHAGMNFGDIARAYISGGFGTYLDIEKAVIVGLLPDIPRERFSFIGNSSVKGAKLCLLSGEAREKAKSVSEKMTYVELSTDGSFMNEYTSTLFLPHTDLDLFPSVKKMLNNI
jgi:uncharacterized 2Fe-2S/4Fe-4S cluster protein (DUF4445 family)